MKIWPSPSDPRAGAPEDPRAEARPQILNRQWGTSGVNPCQSIPGPTPAIQSPNAQAAVDGWREERGGRPR